MNQKPRETCQVAAPTCVKRPSDIGWRNVTLLARPREISHQDLRAMHFSLVDLLNVVMSRQCYE